MSAPNGQSTVWGMSLQERIIIVLVSALIIGARFYLRIPLHVPGHSGAYWMALLIIGAGLVGKRGAGSLIGLITGILAVFLIPGREGLLTGLKYFVPGVIVDVFAFSFGGRLDSYPVAILAGAAGNVGKLTTSYIIGLLAGIPSGYLAVGLGIAATTHLVFGAVGGWLGAFVLKRLARAGVTLKPTTADDIPEPGG